MSFSQYPQNPVIGQEYTVGTMIVTWDGTKFVSVPPNDIVTSSELSLAVAAIDADRVAAETASAIAIQYPEGQLAASLALREKINRKATLDLRFNENQHRVYEQFGLTDKVLTDAITTTRGSAAPYNSPFGIATAAINEPRIEYDPLTGECLGLLCEEQRTNLLLRSEKLDTSSWTVTDGATRTLNFADGPFGPMTATRLQFTSADQRIFQSVASIVGQVETCSVYVKGNLGDTIRLGTSTATNITLNGQWQRISFTLTSTSATPSFSISTFGGATARDVLIAGAQLEAGSFPTSYIKTEASQVTRVVERHTSQITYRKEESTIFAQFIYKKLNANRDVLSLTSDVNNRFGIGILSDNSIRVRAINGGVSIIGNLLAPESSLSEGVVKVALCNTPKGLNLVANGTIYSLATPFVLSDGMTLGLGSASFLGVLGGHLMKVQYYPRALSDQELIDLTRL